MGASLQQLAQGTVNEAWSRGELYREASLRAAGFQFDETKRLKDVNGITIEFNGGIASRIHARLERGDRVYHFSDSKLTTLDQKAGGYWWVDEEGYRTLRKLAGHGSLRETARLHLAIPEDWGDMANLVVGTMKRDYWCFKGMSVQAQDSKGNRVSGQFTLDVLQIFVPGVLTPDGLENLEDLSRMTT